MCAYWCAHLHTCVYVCRYMWMWMYNSTTFVYMCAFLCAHFYTCMQVYVYVDVQQHVNPTNSTSFAEHIYTYETCKYMKLFSIWNHFLELCASICIPFIYFLSIPLSLMSIEDWFHNPLPIHFLESYGPLKVDPYMQKCLCVSWGFCFLDYSPFSYIA